MKSLTPFFVLETRRRPTVTAEVELFPDSDIAGPCPADPFRIGFQTAIRISQAVKIGFQTAIRISQAFKIGSQSAIRISQAFKIGSQSAIRISQAFKIGFQSAILISQAFKIGFRRHAGTAGSRRDRLRRLHTQTATRHNENADMGLQLYLG